MAVNTIRISLASAVIALQSCGLFSAPAYSPDAYRGAGRLISNCLGSHCNYGIVLDVFNFSSHKTGRYKLAGLPTEEFAVGFSLRNTIVMNEPTGSTDGPRPFAPHIKITIRDDRSQSVFAANSVLSHWVWGAAATVNAGNTFIYAPTTFSPHRDRAYMLEAQVIKTDANAGDAQADLVLIAEDK